MVGATTGDEGEVKYGSGSSAGFVGHGRQIHRASGHYGGNRMLVDHLSHGIAEQYHVLVKRFNLALKFDAIHQVNGNGHVFPAQCIEERVLQELAFIGHDILRVLEVVKV
jgi:hypothetical protein